MSIGSKQFNKICIKSLVFINVFTVDIISTTCYNLGHMVEKLLKEIGFSDKQIKVYLAILEKGKTTPTIISRITGINRSTVYSVAKDLKEKGIILEDLAGVQNYFVALPPEELNNFVNKEERAIKEKKEVVAQAIEKLKDFSKNTQYLIPKISFIYEEDMEDFLYKQSSEWSRSIMERGGVWLGFQDPSFVDKYAKWIDWFWKNCADSKLLLKLLTNKSEFEKRIMKNGYERRLVKFWGKKSNFTATIWVNGDYLIIINTNSRPNSLVQIHDPIVAHNLREIFINIWENEK